MSELLYGYGQTYAEEAHIVAFPASRRVALRGVPMEWIPAERFTPKSVDYACKTALKNGVRPAIPDVDNEDPTQDGDRA